MFMKKEWKIAQSTNFAHKNQTLFFQIILKNGSRLKELSFIVISYDVIIHRIR